MQDRYRMRAWDKKNKKYIYDIQNGGEVYDYHSGHTDYLTFNEFLESDNFIKQQCTGMTDWKNYLIYEGDVIKIVGPNWRFVIKWNNPDARFTFDALDNVNWWELSTSVPGFIAKGVEVIGNIYENPELLEAE